MSEETSYTPRVVSQSVAADQLVDELMKRQAAEAAEAARLRAELRAQRWQTARERNEDWQREVEKRLSALSAGQSLLEQKLKEGNRDIIAASAMYSAFEKSGALGVLARFDHGAELKRISAQVQEWERRLAAPVAGSTPVQAKDVVARLREIQAQTHGKLAAAEGMVTKNLLSNSLTELGYTVEQRGEGLRATSGRTCVWAKVDSGTGDLQLDMSGFSGLECQSAIRQIEREVGKRGLSLRRSSGTTHGRPDGGALARSMSAPAMVQVAPLVAAKTVSGGQKKVSPLIGRVGIKVKH